jgi:hypothetical protein
MVVVFAYRIKPEDRLDSVIKMLDFHISVLEAKLSYLISLHNPREYIIYNY